MSTTRICSAESRVPLCVTERRYMLRMKCFTKLWQNTFQNLAMFALTSSIKRVRQGDNHYLGANGSLANSKIIKGFRRFCLETARTVKFYKPYAVTL